MINREKYNAYHRAYYQKNKEKINARRKKTTYTYELKCLHCEKTFISKRKGRKYCSSKCRNASWNKKHPEIKRKHSRIFWRRHKERCLEWQRVWRAKNREWVNERQRKYNKKAKEKRGK